MSAQAQTVFAGTSHQQRATKPTKVDEAKRYAAFKVAGMLDDRQFAGLVQRELAGKDQPVMLNPLLNEYSAAGVQAKTSADALRATDKVVRQQKAIVAETGSVLEMRLYKPKNFAGKVDWSNLLVAYPPSGKKNEWAPVEAFDRKGKAYRLDGRTAPSKPVLVVGINRSEAHRAGVAAMNRQLQLAGMQKAPLATTASSAYFGRLGTSVDGSGLQTQMTSLASLGSQSTKTPKASVLL
ncbi:MAG: hypothetical protein M1823_006500 [Watsoniomyces obsoletus]|nr:MAG: hypothetical protein M1823_006500 [Watsoniomyces obsoletus]